MSDTRFWGLKQHAEHWLEENNITDCSVVGLGKGHRGVEIVLFKTNADDFMKQYPMLETKYYKGYFSKGRYSDSKLYVSMCRKK